VFFTATKIAPYAIMNIIQVWSGISHIYIPDIHFDVPDMQFYL